MIIGGMKYRVTLIKKTVVSDTDFNSQKETWTPYRTVFAAIKYKSGTKQMTDSELFNSQAIEVNIRYIPGIDETWRIEFNGHKYKILFINETVFRAVLTLSVEKLQET